MDTNSFVSFRGLDLGHAAFIFEALALINLAQLKGSSIGPLGVATQSIQSLSILEVLGEFHTTFALRITAEGARVCLLNHTKVLLVTLGNVFELLPSRSVKQDIVSGMLRTSDGSISSQNIRENGSYLPI